MSVRGPGEPKDAPGQTKPSPPGKPPPLPGQTRAPAPSVPKTQLGSLAGDDDDDRPPPPKPLKMTGAMRAVSLTPEPPQPSGRHVVPPSSQPKPVAPRAIPSVAPAPPPQGEATVMLDTSSMRAPTPSPAAGPVGESTVQFNTAHIAPSAPAAAPAYSALSESTRMIDMPVMSRSPMVANESTQIMDGPGMGAMLASLAGGSSSSVAAVGEKSVYADGKSNRKKPVLDVKKLSRLKVSPIDPGRLLVQQEAAEARRSEATMMGSIDQFLEKSGLMKSPPLSDEIPNESTMIGKFLGFVGISDKPAGALQAPVGKDPAVEAKEAVAEAPILNGLNPQFIADAIRAGELSLLRLGRDMVVDTNGRALIVIEGQVAMARFTAEVLEREQKAQALLKPGDKKAEKKEMKRRSEVGPLIRMAEANLGLFNEGDLVTLDTSGPDAAGVAVYSVTPIRVLSVAMSRLETWRRTYQFFGDRLRRATDAARTRLHASSGARSLVADFFVRHGLSVAMSLRVREIDKCIECYECEKACEQRYGVKRLSLNGKVLGALDFVDCCHTCVDQRCIDPCAYDAIKFDDAKKEVLIMEDACVGCSLCAIACPYDAIEMHELDTKPLLQIRLQKEDKLGFGDSKPRKAKLRRIASKCDHCVSYEDQACISACPTAALVEIPPEAAFTERTDNMAEAAKKGFESTMMFDANEIFDPKKFYKGISEEEDKGKKKEQTFRTGWLWLLSMLGILGSLTEIVLRKVWPDLSARFYYLTKYLPEAHPDHLEPELAINNIDFRPGEPLALWLGYVGTVIMFASMFYSARKWIPGLKKLGSQKAWFDFHIWAGAVGPMLVMLHTASKLDNWVSLAIYAMLATVISGVIGRYLSTELPDLASQAALQVVEYERKLGELRNRHAGVNVADRFYGRIQRRFATVLDPKRSSIGAGWKALRMMFWDALARPFRGPLLRSQLKGIKDPKARTKTALVATELALFERRRVLYPKIEPLFREWKIVHIPFAIALTALSGIHIVLELLR